MRCGRCGCRCCRTTSIRRLLDLGKITGYRWPAALLYLQLILGLYLLYALGYRLVARGAGRLAFVFAFGAFFCFELVWAYPATAVDVFGYVAHGRLLALHHVNPFIIAPDLFPYDPIIPYLAFPDEPSQYGPVWVLLNGRPHPRARRSAGGSPALQRRGRPGPSRRAPGSCSALPGGSAPSCPWRARAPTSICGIRCCCGR